MFGSYVAVHDISASRTRILFFRQGSFSHINARVAGWLREQFPENEVVEIDVLRDVIMPSRGVLYRGTAAALTTYFRRIACGHEQFRDVFYRTPYLFHAIRGLLAAKYGELAKTALFSVQTQSLYDARMEGVPHFVYTDDTHLASLRYSGSSAIDLASPHWIKLETSIYHRVRRNLVMSNFIRDSLIQDYGCDPSRVVVVGAAPNLPATNATPDNAGYSNRTILFVGIDWQRKGGPLLLDAFRQVLAKIPDARLIVAGCSPVLNAPNVQVLGRVPLPEISTLLLRSSVFAFPSLRAPQGIAAMEALMHGIPVVAGDVGALPEVIEDRKTGRIVPARDSTAFANALIDLLGNPALCREYGEAARRSAPAKFSSSVISERLGEAIRSSLTVIPTGRD